MDFYVFDSQNMESEGRDILNHLVVVHFSEIMNKCLNNE